MFQTDKLMAPFLVETLEYSDNMESVFNQKSCSKNSVKIIENRHIEAKEQSFQQQNCHWIFSETKHAAAKKQWQDHYSASMSKRMTENPINLKVANFSLTRCS